MGNSLWQTGAQPLDAKPWFERGCALGDGAACTTLGLLLETEGGAVDKDLLNRGCAARDGVACALLGKGLVESGQETEAQEWFLKALRIWSESCTGGESTAANCFDAGLVFRLKESPTAGGPGAIHVELRPLYRKECDGGDWSSCRRLGDIEFALGRKPAAEELFRSACLNDDAPSCVKMGIWKQDQKKNAEAQLYLNKAWRLGLKASCQAGDSASCKKLKSMK